MCGLVGVAGDLSFKDEGLMKRLLMLDYFRGPDSTGLAAIRGDGNVHIAKLSSHPIDLFDTAKFKSVLNANTSRVFMGHNRAATRGGVTSFNAHPYQFGHIVGAHNGTLEHTAVKALEKELGETYPVDSMALIAAIERFGVKDAISLASGAWALTWYDLKKKTLNFLRNKERPFWYAYNEEFDRILWASEYSFIEAAMRIGGQHKLFREADTGHGFWQTDEDVHYEYDMDELRKTNKTERPKPVVRVVKGRETTAYRGQQPAPFNRAPAGTQSNVVVSFGKTKQGLSTSSGTTRTSTTKARGSEPKIINLIGDFEQPFGGLISESQFVDMAKYGCGFCKNEVKWGDMGVTVFVRDDLVLCSDCSKHTVQATDLGEAVTSRVFTPIMPTVNN